MYIHNKYESHYIIKKTLGQFTGKQNKNGKDIYEGDIVKVSSNNDACQVIWDNEFLCYLALPYWENIDDIENTDYLLSDNISIEIIGNIHENPELLEF